MLMFRRRRSGSIPGQRSRGAETMLLAVLLGLLALVPLRMYLMKFIHSDFLALALSVHDDSFYYLLPAWHFSTHGYFTFDGLHTTYGFQPLYMLLLTALSTGLTSIEAVLRVGLCVNATLHAATGVGVGLAVNAALPNVRRALRQFAAILAGSVYLLGANLYENNVTLMENPLAAFLYVLLILLLLRALSQSRGHPILADIAIGTLLGCLILARLLPSSLLAVAVMLTMVATCLPRRSTLLIGASMLVPLVIWGIYAQMAFGQILPTSFLVKSEGLMAVVQYWCALAPSDAYHLLAGYTSRLFLFFGDHGSRLGLARQAFLAVGVAALCVCIVFRSWWSRGRTLLVALAAASVAGFFATPILLYARQAEWFYTKWYLFDICVILSMACGVALGFLGQMAVTWLAAHGVSPRPGAAAACIGLQCLGAGAEEVRVYRHVRPLTSWEYSPDRWNHVGARTTLWFRSEVRLEEGERVAAFNAGIVGLLLGGNVVNLDGLANDDIVRHTEDGGTLAEYVWRTGIRYIIDVVPPDQWIQQGINARVIHTEEFKNPKHPELPLYYVTRLEVGRFVAERRFDATND
jgi:hypothetical protein